MNDVPPPSSDPSWECHYCGWFINAEIMADTEICPHGWLSLEGMAMADIKALFAAGAPELSLDPIASVPPETTEQ